MTRSDVGRMRDVELQAAIDVRRTALSDAWRAGGTGRHVDLYDLAIMYAEAQIRCYAVRGPLVPGQLTLFGR